MPPSVARRHHHHAPDRQRRRQPDRAGVADLHLHPRLPDARRTVTANAVRRSRAHVRRTVALDVRHYNSGRSEETMRRRPPAHRGNSPAPPSSASAHCGTSRHRRQEQPGRLGAGPRLPGTLNRAFTGRSRWRSSSPARSSCRPGGPSRRSDPTRRPARSSATPSAALRRRREDGRPQPSRSHLHAEARPASDEPTRPVDRCACEDDATRTAC